MFTLYRMAFCATKGYPEWRERCLTLTMPLEPMLRRDCRALFAKSNGVFIAKYFSVPIHVTDSTPIYKRNSLLAELKTWSELSPDYE